MDLSQVNIPPHVVGRWIDFPLRYGSLGTIQRSHSSLMEISQSALHTEANYPIHDYTWFPRYVIISGFYLLWRLGTLCPLVAAGIA
jgi:hypothetical protein